MAGIEFLLTLVLEPTQNSRKKNKKWVLKKIPKYKNINIEIEIVNGF